MMIVNTVLFKIGNIFCSMVYLGKEWKFERKTIINTLALTFQDTILNLITISLKKTQFPHLIV